MALVVVFGSRDFEDYEVLADTICRTSMYRENQIEAIISGTARGADQLGEKFAVEYDIELIRMPANWDKYGNGAGPIRNREMAEICTHAIGFWDGHSRGTKNMIDTCKELGKPVLVYNTETGEWSRE